MFSLGQAASFLRICVVRASPTIMKEEGSYSIVSHTKVLASKFQIIVLIARRLADIVRESPANLHGSHWVCVCRACLGLAVCRMRPRGLPPCFRGAVRVLARPRRLRLCVRPLLAPACLLCFVSVVRPAFWFHLPWARRAGRRLRKTAKEKLCTHIYISCIVTWW